MRATACAPGFSPNIPKTSLGCVLYLWAKPLRPASARPTTHSQTQHTALSQQRNSAVRSCSARLVTPTLGQVELQRASTSRSVSAHPLSLSWLLEVSAAATNVGISIVSKRKRLGRPMRMRIEGTRVSAPGHARSSLRKAALLLRHRLCSRSPSRSARRRLVQRFSIAARCRRLPLSFLRRSASSDLHRSSIAS